MITLTVDTNVIRDYTEPHRAGHEMAKQLVALHKAGKCEIRLTTRLDVDVSSEPLKQRLESLDFLDAPRIGTVFRVGFSALGTDMLADEEWVKKSDEIMDLLFPGADKDHARHKNRIADVDHLMGHKLSDREVFLTNDGGILDKGSELQRRLGITVVSPAEFLSGLGHSA